MSDEIELDLALAEELAVRACTAVGATKATTRSLVNATLSAALHGPPTLGFPHFVDYLNSFHEGRINLHASPTFERPFPAFIECDADAGIAQLGFDLAFESLVGAVRTNGIAIFTQANSYTTGELGYYARRLAAEGVVSIAATNANAMVVSKPGSPAVYSTNPLAFAFPLGSGAPALLIDQASSETAFVNVVAAASEGRPITPGWAVDKDGNHTTDAALAMEGALLPFGGRKGANVALMVEMLSAGLSGGRWSLDVPDFRAGEASPQVGLTVIAMMPGFDQQANRNRALVQTRRLEAHGVHIPGVSGRDCSPATKTAVSLPRRVYEQILRFAGV